MNHFMAVPGANITMNHLTTLSGARRTINQLTAVPGDSRTMNQLTAVPAFPMRGQACPEPLTCLPREECVSQLRGHTQAQTDILFVCSSAHGENTICCPAVESLEEWDASSTVAVTLRSSVHPSMHLMPSGDACDVISLDRIRNGIVAKQGQFPWMTLLGYRLSDGKLYFLCGGTLINRRYVLTAAHCLQPEGATLELVRLGELDTSTEQDCEEPYPGEKICADPVLDINIEKVVKHKRFNIPFLKNDIALLRLVSEVPSYTDFIRPICLPFGLNLTEDGDKKYQVAGWGKTEHSGNLGTYNPVPTIDICNHWTTGKKPSLVNFHRREELSPPSVSAGRSRRGVNLSKKVGHLAPRIILKTAFSLSCPADQLSCKRFSQPSGNTLWTLPEGHPSRHYQKRNIPQAGVGSLLSHSNQGSHYEGEHISNPRVSNHNNCLAIYEQGLKTK
uniref:Peptidase S1 domain-containing protein n=1 Tax=Timema douglasi TaxID=61478 RepID=A0A7R8VGL2_TIMDO|nr:unnamed protein product [Timema douglasi]